MKVKMRLFFILFILSLNITLVFGYSSIKFYKNSSSISISSSPGEALLIVMNETIDESIDVISTDSEGNIYLVFEVGDDIALAKYDKFGTLLWIKTWGGSMAEYVHSLYIDNFNNIFITGSTDSFGNSTDLFVLKYDLDGNLLKNATWGTPTVDVGYDLVSDDLGNIYVCGYAYGYSNFSLLLKLDNNLNYLWNVTWKRSDKYNNRAKNIVFDGVFIYLSIETQIPMSSNCDIGLNCYNTSGTLLWNTTYGEGGYREYPESLDLDPEGNVYISGETTWPSTTPTKYGFLLIKYNSEGGLSWAKIWGDDLNNWDGAIQTDYDGDVFLAGTTQNYDASIMDVYIAKIDRLDRSIEWYTLWDGGRRESLLDFYIDKRNNDMYLVVSTNAFSLKSEYKIVIVKNPTLPSPSNTSVQGNDLLSDILILGLGLIAIASISSLIITIIHYRKKLKSIR